MLAYQHALEKQQAIITIDHVIRMSSATALTPWCKFRISLTVCHPRSVRSGLATTGIVASIGSGRPVILLRTDIDALPVEEPEGFEARSTVSCHGVLVMYC